MLHEKRSEVGWRKGWWEPVQMAYVRHGEVSIAHTCATQVLAVRARVCVCVCVCGMVTEMC